MPRPTLEGVRVDTVYCVKCIHQSPRRNQVYDHNIIDEVAVLAWSQRRDRRDAGLQLPGPPSLTHDGDQPGPHIGGLGGSCHRGGCHGLSAHCDRQAHNCN